MTESKPGYTTATLAYTGINGNSASFNGAQNRLDPSGAGLDNVGYAGHYVASGGGTVPLVELFSYTMDRDMYAGEIIRIGVVDDSLGDARTGLTSLRVYGGASFADATMVAAPNNGVMDMYFFDITGLSDGDTIEIWGGNNRSSANFIYASIGGVTLDSIPEPSAAALLGFASLGLLGRRRP